MIGARWANAEVGGNRLDHSAHTQDGEEMTVTLASKALNVGGRGIYHARIVLSEGTPEEIADCDSGKIAVATTSKKIRARNKPPKTGEAVALRTGRAGARVHVPEGKTVEDLCREGMKLENKGKQIPRS